MVLVLCDSAYPHPSLFSGSDWMPVGDIGLRLPIENNGWSNRSIGVKGTEDFNSTLSGIDPADLTVSQNS